MRKIILISCLCIFIIGTLCSCDVGHKDKVFETDESTKVETSLESKDKVSETVSPETSGDESSGSVLTLADGETVTLGELEDMGAEYQGYEGNGSKYTFWYVTETRGYNVTVIISDSVREAIDELSIMDDDYDEKWDVIRRELVAVDIENLNDAPLSDAELSKYIGQKVSSLAMDDFEINGYYSFADGNEGGVVGVYVVKNNQEYILTLESAAFAVVNSDEYGSDGYKAQILPFVIENIEYSRPCCW